MAGARDWQEVPRSEGCLGICSRGRGGEERSVARRGGRVSPTTAGAAVWTPSESVQGNFKRPPPFNIGDSVAQSPGLKLGPSTDCRAQPNFPSSSPLHSNPNRELFLRRKKKIPNRELATQGTESCRREGGRRGTATCFRRRVIRRCRSGQIADPIVPSIADHNILSAGGDWPTTTGEVQGDATWDGALRKGTQEFQNRNYNLFTCNCRWVSTASVVKTFLPFAVVLSIGTLLGSMTFLIGIVAFAAVMTGWFLVGTYCIKGLVEL
ncbi:protein RTE1-HOMOLOG [Panicum miliaceum]|uniref:Protein RTE1-HOMOLOG n=1 Tax=Panicum miliaceum TaxID=4540 RepID=A0A3L6TJJ4_PANMI|nr:protein RTE1-HOMOLOG [Panicum miliaceum]